MKSSWKDNEVKSLQHDPLALRVYTSRLLGKEPTLVLHGGGNTSVKAQQKNLYGETEDILYIKGSGWDLATIEKPGFAPVKMDALCKMAKLERLSDSDMVKAQRAAMTDPNAPNPSVEAILHAIIPYKFVDHTHADAVVAISNSPQGEARIREIYGKRILIVPYVMPGFILAREIYKMTRSIDWSKYEGMILLHHGVFTFSDDARTSYEQMIRLVSLAESYLKKHAPVTGPAKKKSTSKKAPLVFSEKELLAFAALRQVVAQVTGKAMLARLNAGSAERSFSNLSNVASLTSRGPLTPDHIIRTKRTAVALGRDPENDIKNFAKEYRQYFDRHNKNGRLTCLDAAPRWAVWPGQGTIAFGRSVSDVQIISDITAQTMQAIQWAEALGGWQTLSEKDLFEMEYWELEQAKLKKFGHALPLQGKVALVTGAASGIGRACVEAFQAQGAAVAALDISKSVKGLFKAKSVLGLVCDLTNEADVKECLAGTVRHFGGLDILVSNAGIFPVSEKIADMQPEVWERSLSVNLTSHQRLLKNCVPFLSHGIDPAVIIVGSKNVPAPGPGVSAYSVAKAGLTQLARVAALEFAPLGIRVNVVHPNQVFDTAIWTPEVLEKRAQHYGMTIDEYKKSNLLKVEITSNDVAQLVCAMAGSIFAKTTGAQIPIDGGNDRVI